MNWRIGLAAVVLAVVGLWLAILWSGPEYRQIPSGFRVGDFEAQEPTNDELEALRASIEKAAQHTDHTVRRLAARVADGGAEDHEETDLALCVELDDEPTAVAAPLSALFDPRACRHECE